MARSIVITAWALIACSLAVAEPNGVRLLRSDEAGLELECTFDQLQTAAVTADGRVYQRYVIPGCFNAVAPGAPALPRIGFAFALPPNRIPRLVSVVTEGIQTLAGAPAPAPRLGDPGRTVLTDPRIYAGASIHPPFRAEITAPAQAGRYKVAALILHPLQFDPARNSCSMSGRIRVRIDFVPAVGDRPMPLLGAPTRDRRGELIRSSLVNAAAARNWQCLPSASPVKSRQSSDTLPAKILIDRDGWYSVGPGDLAAAGINPAQVDPRTIKLIRGGIEIPLFVSGQADGVFDPDDRFEFYGARARGPGTFFNAFTDANVYWLAWGGLPGGRMIEEEGAPDAPGAEAAQRCRRVIHLEQDSLFVRLKGRESDQTDRWFWRRIDELQSYALSVPASGIDLDAGTAVTCRFMLHGFTYLDGDGDHRAVVSLNGHTITDTVWDGQRPCLVETAVPLSWFSDGDNQLVFGHGSTPYAIDSYFLNWAELEYPRRYRAHEGYLEFTRPDTAQDRLYRFTISGMPGQNIEIFKPGVSKITGGRIEVGPSGLDYTVTFTDRSYGPARYVAVICDTLHKLRPSAIMLNRVSSLTDPARQAEYLIIAPEVLESQAAQLAGLRGQSFRGAMVALTTDIYDEFNAGVASDQAIKEYIRYAYLNYDVPPAYVLLMGGGSYDPKNHLGSSKPDYVPVHLSRTDDFGPVPDDDYYARVAGDDFIADLAVGRLPLNSLADYQAWETKRHGYEQAPYTDLWHRDFLMIAGPPNNPLDDFYTPTDRLCATLNPRFEVSKVYSRNPHTTIDLIDQFNEGAVVAAYYGHGGGQVWGHSSFFTNAEAAGLNNAGRWPLVGGFTCYSGAIDIPDTLSLSQQLFRVPGGAIGVFASSGPSWDNWMEQTFIDAVNARDRRRFGDIVSDAELQLFAMSGGDSFGYSAQMMRSYNLLGDPGLRLAVPDSGIMLSVAPPAVHPGDSATVTLTGPFGSGATVLFSFVDGSGRYLVHRAFSATAGAASARWRVPDSAAAGTGLAKAYLKDGFRDWAVAGPVFIGRPAFTAYRTTPAHPVDLDSIGISASVYSSAGFDPDSVRCQWTYGSAGDTLSGLQETAMARQTGDTFALAQRAPPAAWYNQYLNYRVCFTDSGAVNYGPFQRCRIWRRPDLVPVSDPSATVLGGKRRLMLRGRVRNAGETDALNVPIHAVTGVTDSLIGIATVDTIKAGAYRDFDLPYPLGPGPRIIRFIADPQHLTAPPEQDSSNNRSSDLVVPSNGIEYHQLGATGGSGGVVSSYGDEFRWELPDSSLSDSAVAAVDRLTVDLASPLRPRRQPGLDMIGDSVQCAYSVSFTDSALTLTGGRQLTASARNPALDTAGGRGRAALYRSDIGFWSRLPGQVDSTWATGRSRQIGTFLPFISGDSSGPLITARVNQNAVGWGQTIRIARPQFSVLFEDPDGVNLDSIAVKKDGQIVPRSQLNLPASLDNPRAVPLTYEPALTNGDHILEFYAVDNLGNATTQWLQSNVAVQFDLLEIANYPNPVIGEFTTFYFFVGEHADRYQLKIFTVAGRHIRTIEGGYATGTKTFPWDLCDRDGRMVANGVYFFTLAVSQNDRTVTKTGKLAILR